MKLPHIKKKHCKINKKMNLLDNLLETAQKKKMRGL